MIDEQQHPTFHIHNDEPLIVDSDNPSRALQLVGQTLPAAIPDLFEELEKISGQNSDLLNQLIGRVFNTPNILEQTSHVQQLMQGLYKNSRWTSTRLGQIITIARERLLYEHAGHSSMNDWIRDIGIDLNMALRAERLFANVDWFNEINLSYEHVVEANFVQIEAIEDVKAKFSTAISQRVSAELPKTASPEQRKQKFAELQKEHLPDIQAQVQTILNSPTVEDLKQTLNKRSGMTVKACLRLNISIDPRTRIVTYTGQIPLGDDIAEDDDDEDEGISAGKDPNVFTNISNGFQVKFYVKGNPDPVSYIDLPEEVRKLLERMSTPSQQFNERQRQQTQRLANLALRSVSHVDDSDYSSYGDGDSDNYL